MYRKGEAKDKQDLLDFLNYVFSFEHECTDFRKLLPKVYGEEYDMEAIHHLLVEQNRIKAAVGVYPSEIDVDREVLKTGYIGSVSVHPYERKKGYMKDLMKKVQREIVKEKYDLVALSGQRQRYEHFGFYRGGTVLQYQVSEKNLKSYFEEMFLESTTSKEQILMELELGISLQEHNEDTYMDAIYQIYQGKIFTGRKREQFYDIMQSFHSELYAATFHGVCIGYISFDYEEDYINEIELLDMELLPYFLELLMEYTGCSAIGVKTGLLDQKKNMLLSKFAEKHTVGQSQMFHILNFERVCKVLLDAKNKVKKLQNGSVVLEIMKERKIQIQVQDGTIIVETTKNKADVSLTEEQFIRCFLSTDYEQACLYEEIDGLDKIPYGWFPLALSIETADTF